VSVPVKLPMTIRIAANGLNPDASITNRISSLLYLWGSALDLNQDAIGKHGLKAVSLANSGPHSWTIPFTDSPLNADDLIPGKENTKSHLLVVQLEGQFPDPFEGKEIPEWPQMTPPEASPEVEKPERTAEKAPPIDKKPGRLIVAGSSQMFTNSAIGALDNRLFFQNLVDGLALTEDLISIRTKSQPVRYIEALSAGEKLFYRFIAVGLVPMFVAFMGMARFIMRKRRREQYERFYGAQLQGE
jgi:ABC-2 type transport system permease protein